MLKLDNFKKVFSEDIIKIELEHLEYVNKIININGHRLDKFNENFEKGVFLSLEGLQEINIIAYTLHHLDKKGITSSNYVLKVKQYCALRDKLFKEFGVAVAFRDEYGDFNNAKDQYYTKALPFSNPAKLYERIDIILTLHTLDIENKKNFYLEFFNRERIPKQEKVHNEIFDEANKSKPPSENELMIADFVGLYILLPSDQKAAMLNCDHGYKYDEVFYKTLETYQLKQVTKEIINQLEELDVNMHFEMDKYYTDTEKYFEQTIHFHNFLNYPACLYTEAEFLNKKLDTDIYVSNRSFNIYGI